MSFFNGDADVLLFVEGEGHEFLQHAAERLAG